MQVGQHFRPMLQVPARQFARDERMHQHVSLRQAIDQGWLASAEVLNPDGCINQYHGGEPSRRPPPRNLRQLGLSAAQRSEPLAGLTRDQSLQARPHQRGLLLNAGQCPGAFQQAVVDDQRSSHMHEYASIMHMHQRWSRPGGNTEAGWEACCPESRRPFFRWGICFPGQYADREELFLCGAAWQAACRSETGTRGDWQSPRRIPSCPTEFALFHTVAEPVTFTY